MEEEVGQEEERNFFIVIVSYVKMLFIVTASYSLLARLE